MGKSLQHLLPKTIYDFYKEYRWEYPLQDNSRVILFAGDDQIPGYSPRSSPKSVDSPHCKVTLISTAFNEAGSAKEWLESILCQTRIPDEVVITDGGSADSTVADLREIAQTACIPIRVLEAPGASIARGRNLAIQAAAFDLVACTDFGGRVDREWLLNLIAPFELDEDIEVSAGYYRSDSHSFFQRLCSRLLIAPLDTIDPQTFMPSGRSLAMKKSFWARVGGFPEWLSDAGEDTLFDFEAKKQPASWAFVPQALAYWQAPKNLQQYVRTRYRYSKGDGEAGLNASLYWKKTQEQIIIALLVVLFIPAVLVWLSLPVVPKTFALAAVFVLFSILAVRRYRRVARAINGKPLEVFAHILLTGIASVVSVLGFFNGVRARVQRSLGVQRNEI